MMQGRDRWTEEEDAELMAAVMLHGTNWAHLETLKHSLPSRTADSLRLRWHKIKHWVADDAKELPVVGAGRPSGSARWTDEEDQIIMEYAEKFSGKWRKVIRLLTGRTDSAARNRWVHLQQKRKAQWKSTAAPTAVAGGQGAP